jgi:hypothetical protein
MILFLFEQMGTDRLLAENIERTMLGIPCLMVFTRSPYFSQMLAQLERSVRRTWGYFVMVFVSMLFFGQMFRDLYEYSDPHNYWQDFGITQMHMFGLWTSAEVNIAWEMWYATNFASGVLIDCYIFFNTLLFANLVLGCMIGVMMEVRDYRCTRVYDALAPHTQNMKELEKEHVLEDFLTINWLLLHVHSQISLLDDPLRGLANIVGQQPDELAEPTVDDLPVTGQAIDGKMLPFLTALSSPDPPEGELKDQPGKAAGTPGQFI